MLRAKLKTATHTRDLTKKEGSLPLFFDNKIEFFRKVSVILLKTTVKRKRVGEVMLMAHASVFPFLNTYFMIMFPLENNQITSIEW